MKNEANNTFEKNLEKEKNSRKLNPYASAESKLAGSTLGS